MKKRFRQISDDFANVPLIIPKKQRIGVAGEIYMKYCHLGNWDLVNYLNENGCEAHTNGVTWYLMYYVDTHLLNHKSLLKPFYKLAQKFFGYLQKMMIKEIRRNGFYSLDDFLSLKEQVKPYISMNYSIGDGWLVGMECAGHLLNDCNKVMAVQSFCCMPMQTCGKGMYSVIERRLSGRGHIANADIDTSGSRMNYYNRVHLLINQ